MDKQRIKHFITKQRCVPWRVANAYDNWVEKRVRPFSHRLYMILKYHRVNLNTQEYWDKIWGTEDACLTRNYEKMFSQIVEITPERSRVLDVGCGPGLLLQRLRDAKRCIPYGLDISKKAISALNRAGIEGKVAKLPKFPFPDNFFDVVIATEVLEHVTSPSKTVKTMCRKLRDGGLLIVSVPDDTLYPEDELEHLHIFDEKKLSGLLEPYVRVRGTHRGYYFDDKPEKYVIIYGEKG